MHDYVDFLARSQLCDQNVWTDRRDGCVGKVFFLQPFGVPLNVARVDVGVDVFVLWFCCIFIGVWVAFAFDLEGHHDCVVVCAVVTFEARFWVRLQKPFQPFETFDAALEGDEPEPVGEDFVCYDRGVILDVDFFDG